MSPKHLARSVREIRERIYGPDGIGTLADELGLPAQTWANYERGVVMPAEVLLRFLDVTGVGLHDLMGRAQPSRRGSASRN